VSDAARSLFMSIGFDGASASRGLDGLNRRVDNTRDNIGGIGSGLGKMGATFDTQMSGLDKSFTLWERNSGEFATTMQRKQKQIDLVTDKASLLESEISRTAGELSGVTREFGENSEAAGRLKNQLLDLKIQQADYNKELKRLKGFDWDAFERIGQGFTNVGKSMTLGITAPLTAIGGLGLKTFVELEDSWAAVQKVTSGTSEELVYLKNQMNELVTTESVPLKVTEMYGIAQAAGRLGIEIENVKGFAETTAMLGTVTNMTAEQAATDMAQFATVMQMPQEKFDQLGATLVGLGNNMATTESDIMRMGAKLTGAGRTVGLAESEVLGFAAAFSALGINAEAGGTAFTKIMLSMQDSIFNADEKLEIFAAVAGKSVDEFANKFENDAADAIICFVEGLGLLTEAGYNTNEIFSDLGFNSVNMTDVLRRGAGAGSTLRDAIELANASWEENTALTTAAGKRYGTTAAQIQVFKNRLTLLSEQIGSDLQYKFRGLIDIGNRAINWLLNLDDQTRRTVVTVGLVAAAIGPVLLGIGGAISLIVKMKATIGKLALGLKAIKGAFSSGGLAIALFASPIGKVVLIVGALIAIGIALWKNWDKITEWFSERFPNAFGKITETIDRIRNFISDNMESFKGIFSGFTDFIGGIFSGDFARAFGGLGDVVDNLSNIFRSLIAPLEERFPAVFGFLSGVIDNFQDTAHKVIENIKGIFGGLRDFFVGVFTLDFELALNGLGEYFRNTFELISNLALGGFANIMGFFEMLISPLEERFPFIFGIISDRLGIFKDTVTSIFGGVKQIFGGIIDFIVGVFTGDWERAWSGVVDIFGGIFSNLGAIVKAPLNSVISLVNRAIDGINKINVDLPFIGNVGVNIPQIPMLAMGTDFHKGGPAIVGEEGPELVNLPRGSQVIPNDKTTKILGRKSRPQNTDSYNINKFDTASANTKNQSGFAMPPEIKVIIEKIEIGGDGDLPEGKLTQLIEKLKEAFQDVFGELWEDAWYKLSLNYPNITET
jgi:TP901 family phage tail tape measure protein